ncbi:MAG TPA: SGNH/GDSL hydrolase family protein [Nocardioides sp.]|nr:SGNH/GDSL hydrolase family protein [Nocardioides sp.]
MFSSVSGRRRELGVAAVLVLLLATVLTIQVAERARGASVTRCERFATASVERASADTGSGPRVVVIGDSYSVGLGLPDAADGWPSRIPGAVHVAGFSGSGFSRGAGHCPGVSYAERARKALRGGADLVVVEGGLNDVGQSPAEITAGFQRLMRELDGHRVVVVGPALAPSRAGGVPRVDELLADLTSRRGIPYIRTSGLALPYLGDDLHLTAAGHRTFGDAVAKAIANLSD